MYEQIITHTELIYKAKYLALLINVRTDYAKRYFVYFSNYYSAHNYKRLELPSGHYEESRLSISYRSFTKAPKPKQKPRELKSR